MHLASTDDIVAEIADEMDITFVEATDLVDQLLPSEETLFDEVEELEAVAG